MVDSGNRLPSHFLGNDKTIKQPGRCVPSGLTAWASADGVPTSHSHGHCHQKLVEHVKVRGSWERLQKMGRCVELVVRYERSRHQRYAFLFFTRPDLYLCSVGYIDLGAMPEQQLMIFGPRVGLAARQADGAVMDSVRDQLLAARRDTALSLVRHLMFDIADWYCSVHDVNQSLASSCPVHVNLGQRGDATLECWIGRRMRANSWRASYVDVDFTLLRSDTSDKANGVRFGSAQCIQRGRSHQPDPACLPVNHNHT